MPVIIVDKRGSIEIGKNVLLTSDNRRYHLHIAAPVKLWCGKGAKIIIGDHSRIHGACINARSRVEIGSGCLIAAGTQIMDSSGHDLLLDRPHERLESHGRNKPVKIGNNVWIAYGCVILPGAEIGDGSVIGANSVVYGRIPPRVLARGNPAVVVKQVDADF